jgi:hypothetical protein
MCLPSPKQHGQERQRRFAIDAMGVGFGSAPF